MKYETLLRGVALLATIVGCAKNVSSGKADADLCTRFAEMFAASPSCETSETILTEECELEIAEREQQGCDAEEEAWWECVFDSGADLFCNMDSDGHLELGISGSDCRPQGEALNECGSPQQ